MKTKGGWGGNLRWGGGETVQTTRETRRRTGEIFRLAIEGGGKNIGCC